MSLPSHHSQDPHFQYSRRGYRQFVAVFALACLSRLAMIWIKFDDLYNDPTKSDAKNMRELDQPLLSPVVPTPRWGKEEPTTFQRTERRHHYPRVLNLGDSLGGVEILDLKSALLLQRFEKSLHRKPHPVLDDNEERTSELDQDQLEILLTGQFTKDFQTHCVDMQEWQSQTYTVCNKIHELGIMGGSYKVLHSLEFKYLSRGSYRDAWKLRNEYRDVITTDEEEDEEDPDHVVLKWFSLDDDEKNPMDPRAFEMHRIDSVVSQKLTASPYILNIYGHCGLTGIYELGVTDLDHDARDRGERDPENHDYWKRFPLDDTQKALYAAQVTRALWDLQRVDTDDDPNNKDNTRNTTIIHGDIKSSNLILVPSKKHGLIAKLNDFNNSILRKWNVTSQKPCPHYADKFNPSWAMGYQPLEQTAGEGTPLDETVDIFGVGGVLYYILMGKDPYHQYPKGREKKHMSKGYLPPIPSHLSYDNKYPEIMYENPPKPDVPRLPSKGIQAILSAIQLSMKVNPEDRPTSKQVHDLFQSVEITRPNWPPPRTDADSTESDDGFD